VVFTSGLSDFPFEYFIGRLNTDEIKRILYTQLGLVGNESNSPGLVPNYFWMVVIPVSPSKDASSVHKADETWGSVIGIFKVGLSLLRSVRLHVALSFGDP
jgi:hypothetical protein